MPIIFTVDPQSGVPLYLQLIEQIKRSVALGMLQASEQLPTVKQLALDLTINPNTVARAYRDLEREHVIETSPGRGSFVRAGDEMQTMRNAADDVARERFDAVIREAKSLGLDRTAIQKLIGTSLDRWFPEDS